MAAADASRRIWLEYHLPVRQTGLRLVTSACLRVPHRQAATALATILELILGLMKKPEIFNVVFEYFAATMRVFV